MDVFNLDGDPSLENSRKSAIAAEKRLADEYWEMKSDDEANSCEALLQDEFNEAMARLKHQQHFTALEHLWKHNQGY